jgi:hypothetical protein
LIFKYNNNKLEKLKSLFELYFDRGHFHR